MRRGVLITGLLLLTSCASSLHYTPPMPAGNPEQYSTIVNKPFGDTWSALIEYVSQAFFAVENFEKDSGLVTLSFGAADPELYVDCGTIVVNHPDKTQRFDGPYALYYRSRKGADLSGKMNVFAKPLGSDKTLVRVHARYLFGDWTFDSGSFDVVEFGAGTEKEMEKRVCQPTYAAEQAILDAIKEMK